MKKLLRLVLVGAALTLGGSQLLHWLSAADGDGYTPSASEVPVREDYEANAESAVRPDNYKAQLAKIEKDLIERSRSED